MEAPKDKRTKAYKEWVKNHQKASEGLGDTVEKITKATGIKKVVEMFANGKDCGCDDRKEKLNKMFPYQKPNCLTEPEFDYLKAFFAKSSSTISPTIQRELLDIYNRIFNDKREMSGCSSCFINGVYNKLEDVYNEYLG
tara:strand:+ start:185 stop:601 length:417 start_codon:yes stop_codon:yes gene_type:complete